MIPEEVGKYFDLVIVEAFTENEQGFLAVRERYAEAELMLA